MSKLKNNFLAFHAANPQVYEEFDRIARTLIGRGWKHYSSDGIGHIIRWERRISIEGTHQFKMNNNHMAFYARMWLEDNPEHGGFFRLRVQKEP